jgi:hypothetical protein
MQAAGAEADIDPESSRSEGGKDHDKEKPVNAFAFAIAKKDPVITTGKPEGMKGISFNSSLFTIHHSVHVSRLLSPFTIHDSHFTIHGSWLNNSRSTLRCRTTTVSATRSPSRCHLSVAERQTAAAR